MMMKTEKINAVLKVLDYCAHHDECCDLDCPYYGHAHCVSDLMVDTIWDINQLLYDKTDVEHVVESLKAKNKELGEKLYASEKKLEVRDDTAEERRKMLRYYVDQCAVLDYEVENLMGQNKALSKSLKDSEEENKELAEKHKQLTLKYEENTQNAKSMFEVLTCRSNALKDKLNVSEKKNEELAEKLRQSNETVEERTKDLLRTRVENEYLKTRLKYAPTRNCINCDRYDVCMTVAERKARKANNYKPCFHWKKADEK